MPAEKPPTISIITVVFNGAKTLRATIDSIVPQLSEEVEYIIIDGGSTDGTQDIIAAYASHLAYWVSEPDRGIYHAMNKGIAKANGRFLLHINVGDILMHLPTRILFAMPLEVVCAAGKVRRTQKGIFSPSKGFSLNFHNTLHHQGCFYSRQHVIHYNTKYSVFADFDLNQKIFLNGGGIEMLDETIAVHDENGVSNRSESFSEVYEIVLENRGWFWLVVCWLYFKWQGLNNKVRPHAT